MTRCNSYQQIDMIIRFKNGIYDTLPICQIFVSHLQTRAMRSKLNETIRKCDRFMKTLVKSCKESVQKTNDSN